jgi:hypothetical protein
MIVSFFTERFSQPRASGGCGEGSASSSDFWQLLLKRGESIKHVLIGYRGQPEKKECIHNRHESDKRNPPATPLSRG